MKKTYTVELEVTLDDALESQAIEVARDYYRKTGGAREPVGKSGAAKRFPPRGSCLMPGKQSWNWLMRTTSSRKQVLR